ncbi:unnamed protein product [Amoebophrya sp. A25]|nr:unnamed protein product [Amoebophrya sp. A25]|eukprot:GSA25T00027340001.1
MAHKLSSFNKTEIDLFAHRTLSRPFDILIDDGLLTRIPWKPSESSVLVAVRAAWRMVLEVAIVSPTTTFCPAESLLVSDFALEEEKGLTALVS